MFQHEKFEVISMDIGEEIRFVYELVKKTMRDIACEENQEEPIVIVGGGCLSDTYMEEPFRDIDVFIKNEKWMREKKEKIEKRLHTKIQDIAGKMSDYFHFDIMMKGEVDIQEHRVELLFCERMECVYDFDFRFRQFYLYEGSVYVTKGAIQDIKEKKMVLESPTTPFTTFVRGMYFEERFGFSWNEESYLELSWFLARMGKMNSCDVFRIEKNKKYSESFLQQVKEDMSMLETERDVFEFPEPHQVFPRELEMFFEEMKVSNAGQKKMFIDYESNGIALHYRDLKNCKWKEERERVNCEISLEEHEIKELFSYVVEEWKHFYEKTRMKYVYEGMINKKEYDAYQEWGNCAKSCQMNEFYQKIKNEEKEIRMRLIQRYKDWKQIEKNEFDLRLIDIMDVCLNEKIIVTKETGMFTQYIAKDFNERVEMYRPHLFYQNTFVVKGQKIVMEKGDKRRTVKELHDIIFKKLEDNQAMKIKEYNVRNYKDFIF